jgi:hypothetical protein
MIISGMICTTMLTMLDMSIDEAEEDVGLGAACWEPVLQTQYPSLPHAETHTPEQDDTGTQLVVADM